MLREGIKSNNNNKQRIDVGSIGNSWVEVDVERTKGSDPLNQETERGRTYKEKK